MAIQFNAPVTQAVTPVNTIKAEVAVALESVGMPRQVYVTLSDKPIAGYESVEAKPMPSSKDGRIMYNFGARAGIAGNPVLGRLQGLWLLPKDGFTVDAATHASWKAAREEQAAKKIKAGLNTLTVTKK